MKSYVLGQTVRIEGQLRDETDAVIDPTGLRLLLFGPSDSVAQTVSTQPDPTDPTKLYAEVSPSVAGVWRYRWEVPSGTRAAEERAFRILPRSVPAPA